MMMLVVVVVVPCFAEIGALLLLRALLRALCCAMIEALC